MLKVTIYNPTTPLFFYIKCIIYRDTAIFRDLQPTKHV